MGWQDREYANPQRRSLRPGIPGGWRSGLRGLTGAVMVLVAAGFVLGLLVPAVLAYGELGAQTLVPGAQVWRLLTYSWLSAGSGGGALLDVVFNLFFLWSVGRLAEQLLTANRWLTVAVAGVLAGGVGMELLWRLLPGHFSVDWIAGPMPLVFALTGACLARAPRMPAGLLFLPFTIELRWIVLFFAGISLLYALRGSPGQAANLMALGAGAALAKPGARLPDPFASLRIKYHNWKYHREAQSFNDHHAEVDRILAKIKREGMGHLTAAEKKTLKRDTERLRK